MAYLIGRMQDGMIMRHNDGALNIMFSDGEDKAKRRPVMHVLMTVRPKRGEAWRTTDPEQERFAQAVVDALNAAAVAPTLAPWGDDD